MTPPLIFFVYLSTWEVNGTSCRPSDKETKGIRLRTSYLRGSEKLPLSRMWFYLHLCNHSIKGPMRGNEFLESNWNVKLRVKLFFLYFIITLTEWLISTPGLIRLASSLVRPHNFVTFITLIADFWLIGQTATQNFPMSRLRRLRTINS